MAEHLSVRPETLSRWKGESGFKKAIETAYVELLQSICDEQMHLIDKAQEAILRALESDDITEAMRAWPQLYHHSQGLLRLLPGLYR